jgi:hypothetical protein
LMFAVAGLRCCMGNSAPAPLPTRSAVVSLRDCRPIISRARALFSLARALSCCFSHYSSLSHAPPPPLSPRHFSHSSPFLLLFLSLSSPFPFPFFKPFLQSHQGNGAYPSEAMPNASSKPVNVECGLPGCLFNLDADPTEHVDLASDTAHAAVLGHMTSRASAHDATFFQSNGSM